MIVPSIDILDGKVVQLRQGQQVEIISKKDPLDLLHEFNIYGPVAVIDINAALGEGKNNRELIKKMCGLAEVRVGGGIRQLDIAKEYLRAGASQLIIGTAATPEFLSQLTPEKVIIALDHKKNVVVDQGWKNTTDENIFDRAKKLAAYCNGFLCTFVEREGEMSGFPVHEALELKSKLPKPITVAGGVSNTQEAIDLIRIGVNVQVGMALYTNKLDLADTVVGSLDFQKEKLIPTIVQDTNRQILTLAYSSPESLTQALKKGEGIYFSRSQNKIWKKGETSGNVQQLISCRTDCDRDALIFTVSQTGNACHTGAYSCFSNQKFSIETLFTVLQDRLDHMPKDSYTASLYKDRGKLNSKISEEAQEVIEAKSYNEIKWEIADLVYFLSVLATQEGISWKDIENELNSRHK